MWKRDREVAATSCSPAENRSLRRDRSKPPRFVIQLEYARPMVASNLRVIATEVATSCLFLLAGDILIEY
jgi:hypothetical protein